MGFISHFLAGGLFNRSEMNKKLDEISCALNPSWKLIAKIDNTSGYSGEWVAPDVFGDGSAYDLGAYMIGAGGSGSVQIEWSQRGNAGACGGASGYGNNVIFQNVAPGSVYVWVIGKKGASVSVAAAATASKNGNTGGTTSFAGATAPGGGGGKPGSSGGALGGQAAGVDSNNSSYYYIMENTRLYGCVDVFGHASQSPREGQNQFDQTMVSLCAGGSALGNAQTVSAMPDGTKGGNAAMKTNASATGGNATGYGNGGGAALVIFGSSENTTQYTAKSGAGSDGVIFLYARKAVTE